MLEKNSKGADSTEQIDTSYSEEQSSGDVAWIVESHYNTCDAYSDKRPKEGKASHDPVFQEYDCCQGKEQRGYIAGKRVKTIPTHCPFWTYALEAQRGIQNRAYVSD
jgi:hypothetical protein